MYRRLHKPDSTERKRGRKLLKNTAICIALLGGGFLIGNIELPFENYFLSIDKLSPGPVASAAMGIEVVDLSSNDSTQNVGIEVVDLTKNQIPSPTPTSQPSPSSISSTTPGPSQPPVYVSVTDKEYMARGIISTQECNRRGVPVETPCGFGNDSDSDTYVLAQGWDGEATHIPPETKGGYDLTIDINNNGLGDMGDSEGYRGHPVYATASGVIQLHPDSWPAGNHMWIKNAHYKIGFAHFQGFAVEDGEPVERGELIGYAGDTGRANGVHVHYHIWKDGFNVNPGPYVIGLDSPN